jgi:ApaG protein
VIDDAELDMTGRALREPPCYNGGMIPSAPRAPQPGTSEAVTRGIRVAVEAVFSPPHSRPAQQQWFFVYTITITNEGDEPVQLVSRHWIITDAVGSVEHVRGLGVVGEQPVLEPGESFVYSSGCPLTTPSGDMRGTYQMVTGEGDTFDVEIARFELEAPYTIH